MIDVKKKAINLIFILLLIFSFFFFWKAYEELNPVWKAKATNEALKDMTALKTEDPLQRDIDFEALKKINPDIMGWIYIPDTAIDYPILKGKSDEEYLYKDIERNYNRLGSVTTFSDTYQDFVKGQNFIYAHNGVKNMMFGDLYEYKNEEFRQNHLHFYIYTENKTYECSVFSIFVAEDTEAIYTHQFDIGTYDYIDRLEMLVQRNDYDDLSSQDLEHAININKEVFTLLTCDGNVGTPYRLLINATVEKVKYMI